MYEENLKPLPLGDASVVFAKQMAAAKQQCPPSGWPPIEPTRPIRFAARELQPYLVGIARRLLLPGSRVAGYEHLATLGRLAREGRRCIVCLNHRSNLDVPTLCALLEDQHQPDVFHRIIWIAGRKLQEDESLTGILVQGFNQVIVTPRSWLSDDHSESELRRSPVERRCLGAVHKLKREGWIFGLFPAGTRLRPGDESTARAIEETDSYLKTVDFMVLGYIDGCSLPVSRNCDFTHEVPRSAVIVYTFGPVLETSRWRSQAARRYPNLGQRGASAQAIMEDIASLSPASPTG